MAGSAWIFNTAQHTGIRTKLLSWKGQVLTRLWTNNNNLKLPFHKGLSNIRYVPTKLLAFYCYILNLTPCYIIYASAATSMNFPFKFIGCMLSFETQFEVIGEVFLQFSLYFLMQWKIGTRKQEKTMDIFVLKTHYPQRKFQ